MGLTQKLGTLPLAILTDASNNVGIGGSPSGSYKLEVTGTGRFTGNTIIGTRTTGNIRNLNIYGGTNNNAILKLDGADGNGYGAQVEFISKNSGGTSNQWTLGTGINTGSNTFELYNGTGVVMAATIAGNVGIGTSSPADLLEVKGGNIRLSALAGVGPQFNLYSNGQTSNHVTLAQGFALSTDNIGYLYNRANADFVFGTNNTERMRILANGQMNPGADNSYGFGGSGIRWAVIWAANGTIQTSDKREKKDIKESDLGLNFISKLNPVSFKWIVGHNEVSTKKIIDVDGSEKNEQVITPREGKRKHYGLIAQEVKEALNGVDFGGFIEDEETGIMGLRYDQFVPLLIKAIQELSAQKQDLKSRLDKAGL